MKITIDIGEPGSIERTARVRIAANELAAVHLHLASPEKRNRTGFYMRRHPSGLGKNFSIQPMVGPDKPLKSPEEPPKIPIPAHIEEMLSSGMIPSYTAPKSEGAERFGSEASMIAVPISDLVANLLRPCYHCSGLGEYRLFYFDEEPISLRNYWCACFFGKRSDTSGLELRYVRFDRENDQALDVSNGDLAERGLIWAAALVPLVVDGQALSPVEIAQNDYDLGHILGRQAEEAMRYAYQGWFDEWDERVEKVVLEHQNSGKDLAKYYHSILGLDESKNIHLFQVEGALAELAGMLASEGITTAGVLDSGGSCALYDVWMGSYLNHSWYFREPRGSILVFELGSRQRIPQDRPNSWIHRRKKVEK